VTALAVRLADAGRSRVTVVGVRWIIILATIGALEALTRNGAIEPIVMPPPSDIASALADTVRTAEFRSDLARTALEVCASCTIGIIAGLAIGALSARVKTVGDVAEPYLVTLYAMPTLVFYPILLAIMGLGSGPIITITSVMVVIPVALNAMVGLRSINPVLIKMGRSMNSTPGQLYRKVLLPAATPLVIPGIKLGIMYGIIGTVAMEFILADRGLGYRIGHHYNNFAILDMWTGIVVVMVLAMVIVSLLGVVERRVRRDMT
jgi:NitT/TauT family transport system permease protein